jgi:hypothetical protein
MYDNPNGNDYSASGTISFKYNSSERVVFWKQYGFGELNGNRRYSTVHVFMVEQRYSRRPNGNGSRSVHGNGNGCKRLYGTNECNDYATASGLSFEHDSSKRVMQWKQHGLSELNGNRRNGTLHVFVVE